MLVEGVLLCMLAAGTATLYFQDICRICEISRDRYKVWHAAVKDRREGIHLQSDLNSRSVTADAGGTKDDIRRLLLVTLGTGSNKAGLVFTIISVVPPLIFVFAMADNLQMTLLLTAALIIGIAPYIWLRLRLKSIRTKASGEGILLLIELLDNYKINYYNIREAVEATALTIQDAPNSKRLLFNLSKGLNNASDPAHIRKLLDDFRYSFGTLWAKILTDNVFLAVTSGIRIDEAMEDLIHTVERARDVDEYIKRENNEAVLILRFLAPACYGLTVVSGIKYFGLSLDEFMYYQFETTAGAAWFTASLVLYLMTVFTKDLLMKNTFNI